MEREERPRRVIKSEIDGPNFRRARPGARPGKSDRRDGQSRHAVSGDQSPIRSPVVKARQADSVKASRWRGSVESRTANPSAVRATSTQCCDSQRELLRHPVTTRSDCSMHPPRHPQLLAAGAATPRDYRSMRRAPSRPGMHCLYTLSAINRSRSDRYGGVACTTRCNLRAEHGSLVGGDPPDGSPATPPARPSNRQPVSPKRGP